MRAYHFLRRDLKSGNGNEPAWSLGERRHMPRGAPIELCVSGYHSSSTPWQALMYAPGPVFCEVEVTRPVQHDDSKRVSRSRKLLRYIDATSVLHELLCLYAEDVLPLYEGEYPHGRYPRVAIETKRLWLRGEATDGELAAAREAAEVAAWAGGRIIKPPAAQAITLAAAGAASQVVAGLTVWSIARAAARGAALIMAAGSLDFMNAKMALYRQWANERLVGAMNAQHAPSSRRPAPDSGSLPE